MQIIRIRRHRVFIWPTAEPVSGPVRGEGIKYLVITSENLKSVLAFRDELVLKKFSGYLAAGKQGVFAIVDGQVSGYAWATINLRAPRIVNGFFRLRTGEALIHDCHIATTHRGKGIYQSLLRKMVEIVSAHDPTVSILIDCASNNLASIRGIARSGFEELGQATYVTVGHHRVLGKQNWMGRA